VRITVSVGNQNNLVAGLFAEGRVAAESHEGLVEVELGIRDEERGRVEITKGLAAGDTLLVGAALGISPGTPVRVSAPTDQSATGKQE
jgi:hypothetical protein